MLHVAIFELLFRMRKDLQTQSKLRRRLGFFAFAEISRKRLLSFQEKRLFKIPRIKRYPRMKQTSEQFFFFLRQRKILAKRA